MRPVKLTTLADAPIVVTAANDHAPSVRPGSRFKYPVLLANDGDLPIGWTQQNPLHLAYRWLDQHGEMVERDGLRTIIPVSPIAPGTRFEVDVVGHAPDKEGSYQLQLSLVLEGVHWACDIGPAGWVKVAAQVAAAAPWPAELRASRGARALRGAIAARELARQLKGQTFTQIAAPTVIVEDEPLVPPQKQPIFHRLGNWIRGALGVSGLENQLSDVLAYTGRNEQQVRDLEAHLAWVKEASRIEVETANDRARLLMDELAEARRDLKTHIESIEQGSQARFDQSDHQARRISEELAKARDESSKAVAASDLAIRQLSGSIGDAHRGLVTDVQVRLMDELGEARRELKNHIESIEQGSQARFDQSDHQARRISEELAKARDEFSKTVGTAQHDITRELREGNVVVELVSNLRQLIAWAQSSGDLSILANVSNSINQLAEQSAERAMHQATRWDRLDFQLVSNAVKIDSLLTRQTIPLATAGIVLVRNRFGLLAIQDDDTPAIAYYSTGDLPEPGTVAIVERLLEPGDCFLDVGANVGIYSLIAGRRVGPDGKIVAIEPSPSTMRALQSTLAINGIAGLAKAHEIALGSAEGAATLHTEATSGHASLTGPTDTTRATQQVTVKRGDAVLGTLKPKLIKVDVEGWELDVLDGLGAVLDARELSLVVEFSPDHAARRGIPPNEWFARLKAYGFHIWVIDDRDISLRPFKNASDLGSTGANLFLSRTLPPALKSMCRDR